MAAPGNTSNSNNPRQTEQVSEKRRRLLKAAAVTAPVIATLQSGAAFANASAYQCIADDRSSIPYHDEKLIGSTDKWVRHTYTLYTFMNAAGTEKVDAYDIDQNDGGTPEPVGNPAIPGTYYLEDAGGTPQVFDATWEIIYSEPANVLALYSPTPDDTDVTGLAGPWPKFQIDESAGGNIPLRYSCLCSVSPSLAGGCGP